MSKHIVTLLSLKNKVISQMLCFIRLNKVVTQVEL